MKKATILFLCILLLVCGACSKANTNIENTTDVDTDSTSAAVDTLESGTPDTDISGIYFNIFGSEYEVSVDNETLEILKSAETATEPLATSLSLDEIGTVSITYKDDDSKREFGKVFLNGSDVYVQSNENEHGAIVKVFSLEDYNGSNETKQNPFELIYGSMK